MMLVDVGKFVIISAISDTARVSTAKVWEKTVTPVVSRIPKSDWVPDFVSGMPKRFIRQTVKRNLVSVVMPTISLVYSKMDIAKLMESIRPLVNDILSNPYLLELTVVILALTLMVAIVSARLRK